MSRLAHLTALRCVALPLPYRGLDADLLRAASPLLPTLTELHAPRLAATRPEIEVGTRCIVLASLCCVLPISGNGSDAMNERMHVPDLALGPCEQAS